MQPTLMQSLLDRKFFVSDTNVNFHSDTVDITYIVDQNVYGKSDFTNPTIFGSNSGEYTVHQVSETNLFVIYVQNYHTTNLYPNNCPTDEACPDVISPGCIKTTTGECKSATVDVCIKHNTTVSVETHCNVISDLGVCVLKSDISPDMCASKFIQIKDECKDLSGEKDYLWIIIITLIVVFGYCVIVMLVLFCCKIQNNTIFTQCMDSFTEHGMNKREAKNEGSKYGNVQIYDRDNYCENNRPPATNPAYYYN
eukprot:123551_1